MSFQFCRLEVVFFFFLYIYLLCHGSYMISIVSLSYLTVLETMNMMVICTICKICMKTMESSCVYIILMQKFFWVFYNLTRGNFPWKSILPEVPVESPWEINVTMVKPPEKWGLAHFGVSPQNCHVTMSGLVDRIRSTELAKAIGHFDCHDGSYITTVTI